MKKIYIADDEEHIRTIISSFLQSSGYEVVAFESGDSLLEVFEKDPAHMVILDIMMPGTDGMSICNRLRQQSNVPIIIISAKDTEFDKITGLTMGSDDYMVKPFSPMELVARVQSIFRRIQLYDKQREDLTLRFGDMELLLERRRCLVQNEVIDITPIEFSFLSYLLQHQERAVSRDELLKNVWKLNFEVCTRAIDDVLKRLRKKISHSNVAIISLRGYGLELEIRTK